jgi:preprotein translocase subunit SecE
MAETDNPDTPLVAPRAVSRPLAGPGRIAQFLRDVRAEMKRVSWPTANEVKNTTIITLIAVIFFAIYLFAVDQGLSRLILGIDWLIDKVARFLGAA